MKKNNIEERERERERESEESGGKGITHEVVFLSLTFFNPSSPEKGNPKSPYFFGAFYGF